MVSTVGLRGIKPSVDELDLIGAMIARTLGTHFFCKTKGPYFLLPCPSLPGDVRAALVTKVRIPMHVAAQPIRLLLGKVLLLQSTNVQLLWFPN